MCDAACMHSFRRSRFADVPSLFAVKRIKSLSYAAKPEKVEPPCLPCAGVRQAAVDGIAASRRRPQGPQPPGAPCCARAILSWAEYIVVGMQHKVRLANAFMAISLTTAASCTLSSNTTGTTNGIDYSS